MPNKLFPDRRSIRLKSFDYAQEGAYFITITTQDRIKLFGRIENQKMILNEFGKILEKEWLLTPTIRPNISLGEFIIMPDHMHMIIHIDIPIIDANDPKDWKHKNPKGPSHSIGAIIRGFKGATTKKINLLLNSQSTGELQFAPTESLSDLSPSFASNFQKNKIWQRNYYEKIIFTSLAYENISRYIINNPKNWTEKKKQ